MLQSGGSNTKSNTSSAAAAAAEPVAGDMATRGGDAAVMSEIEEAAERGFGGNRWPRDETVALLKIRAEMDVAFRDATVKGPLWEEVSRKLGELGYQRSGKKCKEKFENVYKYHKRTKEGRTGKSDGKTYRFFDQLQALETNSSSPNNPTSFSIPPPSIAVTTVPSTTIPLLPNNAAVSNNNPPSIPPLNVPTTINAMMNAVSSSNYYPGNVNSISEELFLSESPSSSSSTSSDVEIGGDRGGRRRKRKKKWNDFFERMMKQVVEKQEEMQRRFLETVEKRERERMMREESWRTQEMARINREREILSQERSMAAAKDAAVMAFLQKLSENNLSTPTTAAAQPFTDVTPPQWQPQPQPQPQPQQRLVPFGSSGSGLNPTVVPQHQPSPPPPPAPAVGLHSSQPGNGERNILTSSPASSSRWPKVEIEALIKLRTDLDSKYQENVPKGPLWEDISAGMKRLGYNRNAKRCKEKWENINKYFKKVKESNKKRPEDSKTCPYFHQLEALYRQKNRLIHNNNMTSATPSSSGQIKPGNAVPVMVQPEQQWQPAPDNSPRIENRPDVHMENVGGQDGQFDRNADEDDDDDDDDGEDDDDDGGEDDDGDEDEDGGEFEVVPNNSSKTVVSMGING